MEPSEANSASVYTHFVTFTLQPHLNGKGCRQQLRATFNKANFELQRVCKSYKLVAELTKKCNIHYHAIVQYDVSEYFAEDELNLILQDNCKSSNVFGRMDCERIKDIKNVSDYIIKDIAKTDKIVNTRGKKSLDIFKDWSKGMVPIKDKKVTRLKDYLTIDNNIQDDVEFGEEIQKAIKINLININKNTIEK